MVHGRAHASSDVLACDLRLALGSGDVVAIAQSRRRRIAVSGQALLAAEAGNVAIRCAGALHCPEERRRKRGMGDFVAVRGIRQTRMGGRMGKQLLSEGVRGERQRLHTRGGRGNTFALEAARARLHNLRGPEAHTASVSTWQSYLWLLVFEGRVSACRLHESRRMGMATTPARNARARGNRDAFVCVPLTLSARSRTQDNAVSK